MVKKGAIRRSGDTSRYVVRFRFKDKTKMVFGETQSFYEVQKKYRICMALLKGEIIPEMAKLGMLTDESYDETEELLD